MHTISIFVDKNRMPKPASYFECQTRLVKNLRNAANFIIRNLRTGLKKAPDTRNANENEVLETVRIGIEMANEKLLKDVDRLTKQLQSLLDTKETQAQELQTLVDERQEKADALDQILQERQEKADDLTHEVEKQIDSIIAKVAAKMDEIEATMKDDVAEGKRFNEEKAKELKESLEQVQEQLTVVKNDLSEKVHSENVKCYRNVQDLFRSMDEKVDRLTQIESKVGRTQGLITVTLVFGIINFGILIGLLLMNLGVLGL